jgi:hypothetical protein
MGSIVHIPRQPTERPPRRRLSRCPGCESSLMQPQGWKELPSGELVLQLRCPDCLVVIVGTFSAEQVARYDAELLRGHMSALTACFAKALELDLLGPDDFGRCDVTGYNRPSRPPPPR